MTGVDYVLDTNFILGLLKSSPEALALIEERQIDVERCGYSAISRMELLGFRGITGTEDTLIRDKLAHLTYLAITSAIEEETIRLRRTRQMKLPDAIIAASALDAGAELLTFDRQLQSAVAEHIAGRGIGN